MKHKPGTVVVAYDEDNFRSTAFVGIITGWDDGCYLIRSVDDNQETGKHYPMSKVIPIKVPRKEKVK